MCGGNLGFVWNVDKRRVVLMAPTVGGGWEDQDATKVYAVEEGERIGYGLEQADAKYGVWLSDVSLVGDLTTLSLAESIDLFNPECGDVGDAEPMLHYLRFFLQNESIQGCADAAPFCTSISSLPDYGVDDGKGWATRMLCSETCGCRNPAGENLLVQGCPYGSGRACQVSESFLEQRQNGVCLEKNASSLQQFAPWVQWIEALTSYGNQSATFGRKAGGTIDRSSHVGSWLRLPGQPQCTKHLLGKLFQVEQLLRMGLQDAGGFLSPQLRMFRSDSGFVLPPAFRLFL